jgi:chemotaxis protein histidine kinase CheA
MALSTKDYLKDGTVYINADKPSDPTWAIDAGVAQTDVYGVTFHVTFEGNAEWYGGGIGANSNSTGWKSIEWGTNSKEITADVENNTITWLSDSPIFAESDEYAQLWLQTWTGKVTVNSADVLGQGGTILSTDDAPAETEAPAEDGEASDETEAAAEETEAPAETEAAEEETEAPAETEAAAEETEAPAEEAAAPAVDYSALTGDVISDTEATSAGAWGQAITLTTVKNDDGVFDPSVLTPDKAVVVYYTADTAPEVVLQSWSGGEGWAKVPADETLSTDGVAVYTYEYMTAMYQSDDFVDTLDAFIVGDTGSELTVSKVLLVDVASLSAGAVSDEEVIEDAAPAETESAPAATEAAPVETAAPAADSTTTPVKTGNTAAASVAAVMAVAGAAAFVSKRK